MTTSNPDRSNLLPRGWDWSLAESILSAIKDLGLSRAQTIELQDYIKQLLDKEKDASKGFPLELLVLDKFQHKWVTWREQPLGKMQSALRTLVAFLRSGRLLVQPLMPLATTLPQEKRSRPATRPQSLPISGSSRNIRTPPPWPPSHVRRPSAILGTPSQQQSVHNGERTKNDDALSEGSSHVQNAKATAETTAPLTPRAPSYTQTPANTLSEAELETLRKRCFKSVKGLSHEVLEIHDVPSGKATLVIVESGPLSLTPFIEYADDEDRPDSPILGSKLRRTRLTINPGDRTTETSAANVTGHHHRSPTTQGRHPLITRPPPIDRTPAHPATSRPPPTRRSATPIQTPSSRTQLQPPLQQRPMTYPHDAPAPAPTIPAAAATTTVTNHKGTDPWVRWARVPPPGRAPAPTPRAQAQPQPQPHPQPQYRSQPRPCSSRSTAGGNGPDMPTAIGPQATGRQITVGTSPVRPNGGGGQREGSDCPGQGREQERQRQREHQQEQHREEDSASPKEGDRGHGGCLSRWSCLPASP